MKKIVVLVCSICFVISALAQSTDAKLVNKKGLAIHPEVGDWSIGIDATPFLNYAGNFLKITQQSNTAPTFGFTAQNPGTIVGKYVTSENKFYRVGLTLGITARSENEVNFTDNTKTNTYTYSAVALGLSVGIEKHRTVKNRLAGYYGCEVGFMVTPYTGPMRNSSEMITGKVSFENTESASQNFSETGGNTITIGAAGFVGVEYFFAPKMSIGGELGLNLNAYSQGERKYEPESGTKEVISAKKSGFELKPAMTGDLILQLYF